MTLFIVDKRISSGYPCSQCNEPALIKKFFRLDSYEWELYACRMHRQENEFYREGFCARCSLPNRARLCAMCEQELNGQRGFLLKDTRQYLSAATAMFRYGAIRYSGSTT